MIADLALYLAAGRAAHPVADWAVDQVITFGPGVALTTVIYTAWSVIDRIRDRAAYCRQLRHELQQTRHLANAIEQAPLIPTQPGQDDDLLTACWDAWNTHPRKEDTP